MRIRGWAGTLSVAFGIFGCSVPYATAEPEPVRDTSVAPVTTASATETSQPAAAPSTPAPDAPCAHKSCVDFEQLPLTAFDSPSCAVSTTKPSSGAHSLACAGAGDHAFLVPNKSVDFTIEVDAFVEATTSEPLSFFKIGFEGGLTVGFELDGNEVVFVTDNGTARAFTDTIARSKEWHRYRVHVQIGVLSVTIEAVVDGTSVFSKPLFVAGTDWTAGLSGVNHSNVYFDNLTTD